MAKGAGVLRPSAWLPDGKTLLYREVSADHGSNNIWAAAVGDSVSTPRLIMEAKGSEWAGSVRVSPDAHWMAYTSEEAVEVEVFVSSYPPTNARWQVSTHGGFAPQWSSDGKTIYYRAPDSALMAASVSASPRGFSSAPPRYLLTLQDTVFGPQRTQWAVTRDGRVLTFTAPGADPLPLTVVINWTSLLKQ